MSDEIQAPAPVGKGIITSTIYCMNTNYAYVYEISNGDIVGEQKIFIKTWPALPFTGQ